MATTAGHLASLLIASHDFSPNITNVTFTQGQDVVDVSTFGATAHAYTNVLMDSKMTVTGFWDKTATLGSHTVLQALIGAGSTAFVWNPEGATTGNVSHTGNLIATSYEETVPVAGVVGFTFSANVNGAVTTGTHA